MTFKDFQGALEHQEYQEYQEYQENQRTKNQRKAAKSDKSAKSALLPTSLMAFFISSNRSSLRDDALNIAAPPTFSDAPWHYITTFSPSFESDDER